ncbi:MAG: O-antigen ligase family protein [Flavobacteriales bacterium]
MKNLISEKWFYTASALFIVLMAVSLYFEFYYIALLPIAALMVWMSIFALDFIFFAIVFFTPLSINLEEMKLGGIGMYLPTEPLLFGVLILFLFKLISGKSIDYRIFRHPISYIIYAYFGWMLLTTITSEMPLVSFKFVIARMWFVAAFYFIAAHLFQSIDYIKKYVYLYIFPLIGVIVYTIVRHSQYGFDKVSAHWVMEPLFKDHTSYGAVLAMYFPITIGFFMLRNQSLIMRVFIGIAIIVLTTGLILSFTRAAWISVVGAVGILMLMALGIRLRTVLIAAGFASTLLILSWEEIQITLESNKQESSDKLEEHVTSISNVSSDASNLERLNRWHCAIELFKERPIVGWGPGTYQFVYAPFQRSEDRTIISTNQGDGGNAHSEYLGPLAEQGVLGSLIVIALLLAICHYGFSLYHEIADFDTRLILTGLYLGLMTYFIHGVLNNYLDTDKASIPFWGFIAVLVAVDTYHRSPKKSGNLKSPNHQ